MRRDGELGGVSAGREARGMSRHEVGRIGLPAGDSSQRSLRFRRCHVMTGAAVRVKTGSRTHGTQSGVRRDSHRLLQRNVIDLRRVIGLTGFYRSNLSPLLDEDCYHCHPNTEDEDHDHKFIRFYGHLSRNLVGALYKGTIGMSVETAGFRVRGNESDDITWTFRNWLFPIISPQLVVVGRQ